MHQLPRRRRFLLMILFCEVALFTIFSTPQSFVPPPFVPPVYYPVKRHVQPSKPVLMPQEKISIIENLKFENESDRSAWEEKLFNGKTSYEVVQEDGQSYLKAKSSKSCSGYFRNINLSITRDMELEWSWRAREFPARVFPPRFNDRKQDDYAARVYLIFPAANYFKSDVIEYLWDERAEVGTVAESPFSDRIKMLVVRSGQAPGGQWVTEKRNILEDYQKLFGRLPERPLGIVSVMSDSDNTRSQSAADFGPIRIIRKTE
jgi:hypothetical protein